MTKPGAGSGNALLAIAVVALAAAVALAGWFLLRPEDPILRYDTSQLLAPQAQVLQVASKNATVADPRWIGETARRAGIPVPAMRAYADAALRIGQEHPDCRMGWTTLAGVGYVESTHGTIGGRTLLPDGRSDPLVLGPALDGRGDVAAIPSDAQSVRWHGDPQWDHAVGPMQFIPSSWEAWASDGDRDGTRDPNDIDDAAYAAARYLCADGRAMDGTGWSAAILSYNRSDEYVRQVFDAASAYASRTS